MDKSYFYDFIPVQYEVNNDQQERILTEFPPPQLPDREEYMDIQNESTGNQIKIKLLLNDFNVHLTKKNKQFLRISFSNNAGVIHAVLWDNQGEVKKYQAQLESHSIFQVEGRITEFNGRKSITISKLTPIQDESNPFSLLPYTKQDLTDLTVELFSYLEELQSPFKEISIAAMKRFWSQFRMRPAAKGFHHNYLGGLLKHTVGLMRFARYIMRFEDNHFQATMKLINVVEKAHKNELWSTFQADGNLQQLVWKETIDHLYNFLQGMMEHKEAKPNYDLVMTSILYHDIGKLLEYDHAGKDYQEFEFLFPSAELSNISERKQAGITMDELGVMIGHIPYGVLILSKIIETEQINVSLEDIHHMAHCILCHHGLPEWGSAIRSPQTVEGYIIHIVDFLDSRYENTETIK